MILRLWIFAFCGREINQLLTLGDRWFSIERERNSARSRVFVPLWECVDSKKCNSNRKSPNIHIYRCIYMQCIEVWFLGQDIHLFMRNDHEDCAVEAIERWCISKMLTHPTCSTAVSGSIIEVSCVPMSSVNRSRQVESVHCWDGAVEEGLYVSHMSVTKWTRASRYCGRDLNVPHMKNFASWKVKRLYRTI